MSYLALYRRFRPTTFNQVIGQDVIVTTLINQLKTQKIGHAYLFCGARGTGKTSLAKILARAVNCLDLQNGSPCGKCEACKTLLESSNIDIIEIDAASNNRVENIRDLRETVQYPPVSVKYKVYIVDEVHMLSTEAFNALLKTLEEPPKHAIFILATTEPNKLPATILSRCMRFDFKLVGTNELCEIIEKIYDEIGKKYTKEAVMAIAKAGEGSVRDALSVADLCISIGDGKLEYDDVLKVLGATDTSTLLNILKNMFNNDAGAVLSYTSKVLSLGKSVSVLAKDITQCLRDIFVVKTCKDARLILSFPNEKFLEYQSVASLAETSRIFRAIEIMSSVENALRFSNQPRSVIETALIKATIVSSDLSYDGLLARISQLEEKLNELKSSPMPIVNAVEVNKEANKEKSNQVRTEVLKVQKAEVESKVEDDFIPPEDIPPEETFNPQQDYFEMTKKASKPKVEMVEVEENLPFLNGGAPVNSVKQVGGITAKKIWGTVLRKLHSTSASAFLSLACQDATAILENDNLVVKVLTESQKSVLLKEENFEIIKNIVSTFGNYKIIVTTASDSSDSQKTEIVKDFFKGVIE